MFEKLNALKAIHEEAMKKLKADGEQALKETLKSFFEKFPEVEALRWTQYTPYFNDGDACEFGVNEADIRLKSAVVEDEDDGFISTWSKQFDALPDALQKAMQQLNQCITSNAMEAVMQGVFGDHVQVTATAEQIDVDSYNHE